MGTALIGAGARSAVTGKFEVGAGLGAGRDFHSEFAIDGFDVNFGTESGIDHGDIHFTENDVAFAGEIAMGANANLDVEVALLAATWSITAFASETDGLPVVNTGGDLEFNVFFADVDGFGGAKNGFFEVDGD